MTDRSLESTATLIEKLRGGEQAARERLVERCFPLLRRWAHGRLPGYARDLADTDDMVQVTLLRALRNIERIDASRPGSFLAYLRTILLNAVRDEIRKSSRRPLRYPLDDAGVATESTLSRSTAFETLDAYERALEALPEHLRQAVILRVEFGMTFSEVALELGIPSANAARMQVSRALVKVAEAMP